MVPQRVQLMDNYITNSEFCNRLQDIAHEGLAESLIRFDGNRTVDKIKVSEDGYVDIFTKPITNIEDDLSDPPGCFQC